MFGVLMIAALQGAQGPAAVDLSQPPELRRGQAVITFKDYPEEALRRKEYGIVSVLLHVSVEGRVISCDITETSGSSTLDRTTCSLLKRRARFEPARDAIGSPTNSTYRLSNRWGVDENQPETRVAASLQVAAIPAAYQSSVKARLLADASGHVTACDVTTSSGSGAIDRAACTYAKQQLAFAAPKSASSDVEPVAVRYLTATFSTQTAKPSVNR